MTTFEIRKWNLRLNQVPRWEIHGNWYYLGKDVQLSGNSLEIVAAELMGSLLDPITLDFPKILEILIAWKV